ncbi:peroxiredoxin-like family protein [Spongiimicrobium salis]|uniref:peroxiredoxin-like family protein n=1 Tax=Spongiimicrobium salis TaxID=1667022 RepID=UPI00374DF480
MLDKQLKQMRQATMERMPQHIIEVFKNGLQEIINSGLREKSLQLGDTVPNAPLTTMTGETKAVEEYIASEYLILNFYRGGWCPYCNLELREYERLQNDFSEIGVSILAISAERPQLTNDTALKNILTYPIATDVDARFMKTLGIVFSLDEATKKEYRNFGIDLGHIHGNNNDELPVPAVYVINKNREIVFVHFEEDYMTRLEPLTLLEVLKTTLVA